MLRSAPHLRRGALLIRGPRAAAQVPVLRGSVTRCTAPGTRGHPAKLVPSQLSTNPA